MLSRRIKIQVIAFTAVALIGVSYTGARYAGVDRMFGEDGYPVTVELTETGGLFPNAEVTYLGMTIGRVGDIRLTGHGAEAQVIINDEAPKVPADTDAVVANRSAVGEQYLDFRPRRAGGPTLAEGAVIPKERTRLPLPVESVLASVDDLVASVPLDALRTVVDETYETFRDTGPGLQVLLDTAHDFSRTAVDYMPQTTRLISEAGTVLDTQNENADAIRSFSGDLRRFAETLKNSDQDLRELISATPPLAREISILLRESGPDLGLLFANLLTTAEVMAPRLGGLEHSLVVYPMAIQAGRTVVTPEGKARVGHVVTYFDPLPCAAGYQGTVYREGRDVAPAPLNTGARCALPDGHPGSVRGSQNAPAGSRSGRALGVVGPTGGQAPVLGALEPGAGADGPASMEQLLGLSGSGG